MPAGFPDKYTQLWGHTPVGEVVDDDSVLPAGITVDSPLEEAIQYALENAGGAGSGGDSAYQVAVDEGFVGDETAWLASLVGAAGADGVDGTNGTNGTQGPVGATGATGAAGPGLPSGGIAGQIAVKASGTDYDTAWAAQQKLSEITHGHSVSIHEYSDDVGTADAAVDTAAFAWLRTNHPTKTWVLGANTYYINSAIDRRTLARNRMIGCGPGNTTIQATYLDAPIMYLGDCSYSVTRGMTLRYASIPTNTAAAAIELDGSSFSQSIVDDILMYKVAKGINQKSPLTEFSNSWTNIRVRAWDDMALDLAHGGAAGTGSVWSNIYLNNIDEGSPGTFPNLNVLQSTRIMHIQGRDEIIFNQLNLEAFETTNHAVLLQGCGAVAINGLHVEAAELGSNKSVFDLYSAGNTSVRIQDSVIDYSHFNNGTNAIFELNEGVHLTIENMRLRDNEGPYYLLKSSATAGGRTAHLRQIVNEGDDTYATVGMDDVTPAGFYNVDDDSIRQYNDDWSSLVSPDGTVYRVTVANGGTLSAT